MADSRVQKLADILVEYAVGVRAGDWVVIQTTTAGEPLAHACQRSVLRAGGNPTTLLSSESMQASFLREAGDDQARFVSPVARLVAERADCIIRIGAPESPDLSVGIDPARLALMSKAAEPLAAIISRRDVDGLLRRTVTQYPTAAAAEKADMSLAEYEDFVYRAGFLEEPDPVAAWQELSRRQQRLVEWMRDKRMIRIAGPETDLMVSIAGRTWVNSDGHRNFPSGEIFTGPVEDATSGTITFNYPAYIQGKEVSGVRLRFERGVVIEATAAGGEDVLRQMLDLDEGSRRLGEFAFGTNPGIQRFTRNTLFDEKIGGTLHMALGRAYPETGGTNVSALHWDMVYDLRPGGEVYVDEELFSKDGEILA